VARTIGSTSTKQDSGQWIADAPFITLEHNSNALSPKPSYDGGIFQNTPAGRSARGVLYGLDFGAETAGVAVSADGRYVLAVNMEDDSVSITDARSRNPVGEARLFVPGSTTVHGEYPFWVTTHAGLDGTMHKFYVTSMRDGEVIRIATSGDRRVVKVGGEPGKMVLSSDGPISSLRIRTSTRSRLSPPGPTAC
jgi:DNA-binding beta-propeller fold protein YncE